MWSFRLNEGRVVPKRLPMNLQDWVSKYKCPLIVFCESADFPARPMHKGIIGSCTLGLYNIGWRRCCFATRAINHTF